MVDVNKQGAKPEDYTRIFSLEDRVAIVTGGVGHLGASVSKALASFGAKVVVLSRNKENLNRFIGEYSEVFPNKFDVEVCDVTNSLQVENLVNKTINKHNRIDILVNAAYQKQNKKFEEMSLDDWNLAMNGALTSYFLCTKAVSPFMLKKGKGSVINIASLYSFLGTDARIFLDLGNCPGVDYSVAKGGILQMTRYLATRWAPKGIRVNAISPGYFPKMNPGMPERKDYILEICKRTPMARIGQPDELAGAVVYLASDASSFTTGQNLVVDGGWEFVVIKKINGIMTSQNEYNDLKAVWHAEKLKAMRDGIVTPPIYVRVKPMNPCNHDCYDCVYDVGFSGIHSNMDRTSMIPREKMQEILKDFSEMGVKAVTYSGGGEPLIYPFITETLKKTLESKIDLSIITNGQELCGERAELLGLAEWVRVSSNSCTPEVFSAIRRKPKAEFNKLIENIAEFAKLKKSFCVLGVNFVVNGVNHNQIYRAAKFYNELGVNNIKFTPVWGPNFQTYHAPFKDSVLEQLSRARGDFNSAGFKINDTYEKDFELTGNTQRTYDRCFYMQFTPAIGADCIVYNCHNKAYDPTGILGSIKDKSFKDLWFSEEASKKFKTFDPRKNCKHQCTNDKKNILIKDIMASHGRHVNFV